MRLLRLGVVVCVVCLSTAATASAQATRTWVSGVGDDVNPCSRTAPCKTFAGAISKTADPGEIDALDPGGYGTVTITKSITIDGGGGVVASILSSGVQGVIINASGKNITLRNLGINGAGTTLGTNGINILAAQSVHLDHCTISNFSQNGIIMQPTTSTVLTVTNSNFSENAQNGLLVKTGVGGLSMVSVDNSRFDHNGNGVNVGDVAVVTVTNSVASGNALNGFMALSTGPGGQLNLDRCTSTNNFADGVQSNGASSIVRMTGNTISNNFGVGVHSLGGQILSAADNHVMGNFGGDGGGTSLFGPS
jgi:Right handed beta helix region